MEPRLIIVDEHRSGDVHCVDQTKTLRYAAPLKQLLDFGRDIDKPASIRNLKPKVFSERFHRVIISTNSWNVMVKVDGQPMKNWYEVRDRLVGSGQHPGSESDMSGRVFAAGETTTVFTPFDPAAGKPLAFDKSNPLWVKMNKERDRVTVEICYSSTLGECWTLRAGGSTSASTTTETRRCPTPSATSFQE